MSKLRRWRSHKIVEGGEITDIKRDTDAVGAYTLVVAGADGSVDVAVTAAWIDRHSPRIGWYFVRYEDGYESASPEEAFVGGYSEVE